MAADPVPPPTLPPPGTDHTAGGIAGVHPVPDDEPRRVAPATADERNTLALLLVPIACWRMDDLRFDFGLSFIKPEAQKEMKLLASLVKSHPAAPLSVFGHADPVGTDDFNKQLSGRRAAVVYGMLIRNAGIWESIYSAPFGNDKWGPGSVQNMQTALGMPADGQAGHGARASLFLAYMDFLCGADFSLQPADFLARGAGAHGKGDYQGCGDFNPVLRASKQQEADFKKPENKSDRDDFYTSDRRVTVFLFRPGSKVDPNRWPCPSAADGPAACRKRFWSDHQQRRQAGDDPRKFEETRDTFECRFYHRIAGESPCEGHAGRRRFLRIYVRDEQGKPMPGEKYILEIGGVTLTTDADVTDGSGMFIKEIGWDATTATLTVRTHIWQLRLLQPPPHSQEDGARVRLANLGFFPDPALPDEADLSFALWDFQHANQIERTAELDAATVAKLDEIHKKV